MDAARDSSEIRAKPTGSHAAARSPIRRIVIFLLGVLVGGSLVAAVPSGKAHDDLTGALAAPENHPLLVHMTTADSWRGAMGLEFAQAMMKIGHPVAVFLNLDAVKLALRAGEQEKKSSMQQIPRDLVADLVRGGAVVLICQPCLEEFGLRLDDVVPGVQLGRPGYLENFVFADNVRTLTW
jgi:predicted peroxiredoxin